MTPVSLPTGTCRRKITRWRIPPTTGITGLAVLVVATFLGFFAYNSYQAREAALLATERQTQNLVRTLEQHTARTIASVDALLFGIIEVHRLHEAAGRTVRPDNLHRYMRRRAAQAPQVRALVLTDGEGRIYVVSDDPSPELLDVSNRAYYRVHELNPAVGLFVGRPEIGHGSAPAFIPVSRRIANADGTFRGVAMAMVDPAYFTDFYASLDVGQFGEIALFAPDGSLLSGGALGDDSEGPHLLAAEVVYSGPGRSGTFRIVGPNGAQIASYAHATGYPLLIAVALAEHDALAVWRSNSLVYVIAGLLIATVMAVLTSLLVQQLRRSERVKEALGDAERDYRSIFDNAVDGIYRCDAMGRLQRANAALVSMYGYASETEMLAASDVGTVWYADRERQHQFRVLLERQNDVAGFVSQVCRRGTNDRIWVSENARAIRDPQGEILFYEGIIRDITASREAEERLREAKEQAELADRTKSEFLANMSHELRTPLNAILGFSEIIKDDLLGSSGSSRYRGYAKDIHESGRHLLDLINEILDLAKVEAGRLRLQEEVVDLTVAIDACRRLVHERAHEQGITLRIETDADLPHLYADPTRLKQILLNLLSNALKFTQAGGVVTLSAVHDAADGMIVFGIDDDGIGMSPEDVVVAMRPFRQVENAFNRRYQGTGLGLPLARSMVELHEGTLKIDSAPGQGTRAEVRMPATRVLMSRPPVAAEDVFGPVRHSGDASGFGAA